MALKDIAQAAGVSISTVSRVLSNRSTNAASESLRMKIWDIAREQGYLPNRDAQNLRTSTADQEVPHSLYCIYACPPAETQDDPFYSKILESIEHRALKNNFIVKYIFSTVALSDPEFIYHFSMDPPDFLIVLGRFDQTLWKKLKQHFKKIIYVGLNELEFPCDQIICNGYEMARSAVDYFCSLGHKKIGYIGSNEARMRGFLKSMADHGLDYQPNTYIDDVMLSMEGGFTGMNRLLDKNSDLTAVFCANDMVSIGALRACKERGIRVPDQMSLLGINDIDNIQYTDPMLSSIHVPLEEMGSLSVTVLVDRISGGHYCPVKLFLPFQIVTRGSCCKYTESRRS